MKNFAFALILLPFGTVSAQDMKTVEQDLLKAFQRIDSWSNYSGDDSTINRYDSLEAANNKFQQALTRSTSVSPSSLHYDFPLLRDSGLVIATSSDRKLRIYSWNTHTGGSMQIYGRVFQYQTTKNVGSISEKGPPGEDGVEWIWKIVAFHTGNHTYYLTFSRAITCGACRSEAVQVFSIGTQNLQGPLPLFKLDGQENSSLSVEFREFGRNPHLRSGHAIVYDSVRNTINIPTIDDMHGTLAGEYITYRWTGSYFIKQ